MRTLSLLLLATVIITRALATASPVVIAHRGASAYLPEHTLEAAAYAHALGADFIEQDLVMSRDNVLVVLHDLHLELTTNVAEVFPERARDDGRFYAIDFTWSELRTLRVNERIDRQTGHRVYPDRYPLQPGPFRLCTLEEQIGLIQGLNQSTGRNVGIYPEIKAPSWHAKEGKDLGTALLALLERTGYNAPAARVFVQCFEAAELKRLRFELGTKLPLIQLIGLASGKDPAAGYKAMLTPAGLAEIASYADGIGPHLGNVLSDFERPEGPRISSLAAEARALGLHVHPYTFRADKLPAGAPSMASLIRWGVEGTGIDGLFTDHPDLAVATIREMMLSRPRPLVLPQAPTR